MGTSRTTECRFPVRDKRPPEPLVSASASLVSLLSWPLGVSVPSFRQCFPPPLVPFPSPLSLSPLFLSLSWNLSTSLSVLSSLCPLLLLSYPSKTVDVRQLQHHFSQLVRPAPFWLTMAQLDGWQAEVGEACLTTHTLVQGFLPEGKCLRVIEVETSYRVVAGSLIIPIFSPLFFCRQENSRWEWAEAADFYILVYVWVRVTPVGWGPTDNIQLAAFQAWSPGGQWTGCSLLHWPFFF